MVNHKAMKSKFIKQGLDKKCQCWIIKSKYYYLHVSLLSTTSLNTVSLHFEHEMQLYNELLVFYVLLVLDNWYL